MTTTEAAKEFGFNRRYLAEMCRNGLFPSARQAKGKFGKMEWDIGREELIVYLAAVTPRGPYRRKVKKILRVILPK